MQDLTFNDGLSVQDADLLVRLSAYCDHLDQRLEQGQGWLIFNSSRDRGARILRLLLTRLDEYRALFNLCHLPWRDFALHAYISAVELPSRISAVLARSLASARERVTSSATGSSLS